MINDVVFYTTTIYNHAKLYCVFSAIIAFVFLFLSCCKTDAISELSNPQNYQDRFFELPSTASKEVKAVAASIQHQNNVFRFVPSLVQKTGLPRWASAKVQQASQRSAAGRDGATAQMVLIPFVQDSQRTTAAVLLVQINGTDTIYRMVWPSQYKDFGFDTTRTGGQWTARDVFQLFATFDYNIFGHTRFQILDDSLLRPSTDSHSVVIRLHSYSTNPGARYAQDCTMWEECHYLCPITGGGGGGIGVRPISLPGCQQTYCNYYETCSTVWIDDGFGGGSGGGTTGTGNTPPSGGRGGGTGNNPWWNTNPCPTSAQY